MADSDNMTEEELITRWEKLQQKALEAREKALNAKNAKAKAKAKAEEKKFQKLIKKANEALRIVQDTVDTVGSEEIQSTLDLLAPDTSTESNSDLTIPKFKNFNRGGSVKGRPAKRSAENS